MAPVARSLYARPTSISDVLLVLLTDNENVLEQENKSGGVQKSPFLPLDLPE